MTHVDTGNKKAKNAYEEKEKITLQMEAWNLAQQAYNHTHAKGATKVNLMPIF